jgi:hypothetical protein
VKRRSIMDRRIGPDRLQSSFRWLSLVSWGLFLIAMLVFHYARPEIEYGLLRYLAIDIRDVWHPQLLPVYLVALWACCGITLVSVLMNIQRNRRSEDHHVFHLILLLFIVLASLVNFYVI